MRVTWKDGSVSDELRLSSGELTNDEGGSIAVLRVIRVRKGEDGDYALERILLNPGARKNEAVLRCYSIQCDLRRSDGKVVKVVIVAAESSSGFYAGLKSPQLSELSLVEGQMAQHLSQIAKQRVRDSAQATDDLEARAEALFGISFSSVGPEEELGDIFASDEI